MRHLRSIALLSLLALPFTTHADMVVVTNASNGVSQLSKTEIINIFMGRFQKLSPSISAFPVDNVLLRPKFYQLLVGKAPSEINSYWARLVFSGRASPPRQISEPLELLDIVQNNKGAITYINQAAVDDTVRVVYAFPK